MDEFATVVKIFRRYNFMDNENGIYFSATLKKRDRQKFIDILSNAQLHHRVKRFEKFIYLMDTEIHD